MVLPLNDNNNNDDNDNDDDNAHLRHALDTQALDTSRLKSFLHHQLPRLRVDPGQ